MSDFTEIKKIISDAKRIVFFGGAGVSTESGIPDFRSSSGLYNEPYEFDERPEVILSAPYFAERPETFYKYYRRHMIYPDAEPNAAHMALARLEQMGKLTAVITQNIDGLHQAAGSRNVIELHGSVQRNYCTLCGEKYSLEYVMESDGVPVCQSCGAIVRPDIVLYCEGLDNESYNRAEELIREADVLIVGGTSLTVYPAAYLVSECKGKFIIINKSHTPYDECADFVIRDSLGNVLSELIEYP